MVNRIPHPPTVGTVSVLGRTAIGLAVWSLCSVAAAAAPSPAHKARVSADLEDHIVAGSQTIRVIVHGTRTEVEAVAARYNLRIVRYMKSGVVLEVNAGQLAALRDDEAIDHLSGDIRIKSSVDATAIEAIGVDQVWAGAGDVPALTGKGVTVAVIDSGIDTRHNALKKRVLASRDFTGGDGMDRYGHGTHVAAIIAGQGGKTAEAAAYRGIAPGAYLLNLRVLGDDGSGTASDVIEAIDWAIDHQQEYNVRVINLSLGAPVLQPYRDDPLCEAVERAVKAGITVVAAAGNYGKTKDGRSVYGEITAPANSPYAIAVGATDTHGTAVRSDDTLASYSSKGPTRYDLIVKPDVSAPGHHIASAETTDSYLSKTYPQNHVSGTGSQAVMQLSGTSMSAGMVSGAVALLIDRRAHLKPNDAKAALEVTSTFMPTAGLMGAGAGSVNVLAATAFIDAPSTSPSTSIAGENQHPSGLLLTTRGVAAQRSNSLIKSSSILWGVKGTSILWGVNSASILWGVNSTSILWGVTSDSILWGVDGQSILWGVRDQSILWGVNGHSILWGVGGASILWGIKGESILWGVTDEASPPGVN
jgi:serine protease AprX